VSLTTLAATLEQRVESGTISATEYHSLVLAASSSPAPLAERPVSRGQVVVLESGQRVVLEEEASDSDESC